MAEHVVPALLRSAEQRSCDSCKWFKTHHTISEDGEAQPTPGAGSCTKQGGLPVDLRIMTQEEALAARNMRGSACNLYNSPGAPEPTKTSYKVGFPLLDNPLDDPENQPSNTERMAQKRRITSCTGCANWISPGDIAGLGFNQQFGMCAIKGEIIQVSETQSVARNCNDRIEPKSRGYMTTTRVYEQYADYNPQAGMDEVNRERLIKDITLFPAYDMKFVREHLATMGVKGITTLPAAFEPSTYTSPVSQRWHNMGLKGWVTLTDPSGTGNTVRVPSFRPDFFDDTERAKIPMTGDDEHPEKYIDHGGKLYDIAVAWTEMDMNPALWGAPGTGKTELARHMAWIMGAPFERLNITDSSALDDIQGYTEFKDGETRFKPGRFVRAWQKPGVILVDEPNVGPKAVWQFFRPVMDDSRQLAIDADEGDALKRDQFAFLIFAMNPEWDMRNDGTNALADADVRRMYHIELDHPTREIEEKIIRAHVELDGWSVPDQLMSLVLTVGNTLRETCRSENLPITWGMSQQIKVTRLLRWFPAVKAYNLAAGYYLDPVLREVFLNEVRATFDAAFE